MYTMWNEVEKKFLSDNAQYMKDVEIQKILNVFRRAANSPLLSLGSVRKMRQRLGIKKASGYRKCVVVKRKHQVAQQPSIGLVI